MSISKPYFKTFILEYLLSLSNTELNTLGKHVHPLTLKNWLDVHDTSVPTAYSLHNIGVFTGAAFYMRSDRIWAEKTTPTCTPVDKGTFVSQRANECICAYERWPGKKPPQIVTRNVPRFSTIRRLAIQFPQTTFVCDPNGMRFDGWDHYPVLRRYNRKSGKYCLHHQSGSTIAPIEPAVELPKSMTPPSWICGVSITFGVSPLTGTLGITLG